STVRSRDPAWGYQRILGELAKLGLSVSATTIRTLLGRHGLGPAPRRGGASWPVFLRQQAASILACDFLTVETVWLKTLSFAKTSSASAEDDPGDARRGWTGMMGSRAIGRSGPSGWRGKGGGVGMGDGERPEQRGAGVVNW